MLLIRCAPATETVVRMTAEPFRDSVRTLLRVRLLDASAAVFAEEGWRKLTMTKVADRAGVSRQTVYNEFGNKQQLAEQLVLRELDTFLDVVRDSFGSEPDLVAAVRRALVGALRSAEENDLLRVVLGSGHTGDSELLPFITQSQGLIDRATEFLVAEVQTHFPDVQLAQDRLRVAMESIVRLVLSHVTRPSGTPEDTADGLTWLVGSVLDKPLG